MTDFDLAGAVRRIRRTADLSQRELAAACGVARAVVAHAESGRRALSIEVLGRAAAVAGLRLALLDGDGREVTPMAAGAVRDAGGRRFPAHLDTRYGDIAWWHGRERYSRRQPWYTFDRDRAERDFWRTRDGVPEDHQLPRPGDSPADRKAARERAAWLRRRAVREAQSRRGWVPDELDPPPCTCPPACDDTLEVHNRHADGCPCGCDID